MAVFQDKMHGGTAESESVAAAAKEAAVSPGIAPLLRRAFMFLEDGDWDSADEYCERVLDMDPGNAEAYLGKLMAELKTARREALKDCKTPFDGSRNYRKAVCFGDAALKEELVGCIAFINERRTEEQRIAAERAAAKRKKAVAITVPIVCACIAFVILLTQVLLPKQKYNEAMRLIDAGEYKAAYMRLQGLDYKDSEEKRESIKPNYYKALFADAAAGDTIVFGSYEQDNDTSNGKEGIEWLVLANEDGKLLVISRYALDCRPYDEKKIDTVTWENCTLRQWLNGDFFSGSFLDWEKAMISTVTVSADKNPSYGTNPGSATQDKIFLLSIIEANRYFKTDSARMCVPTAYAQANGVYTNSSYTEDGTATCWWWLRSPGSSRDCAAGVSYRGGVDRSGYSAYNSIDGIRPALWIDFGG